NGELFSNFDFPSSIDFITSSISTCTTIPLLAKGLFLFEGLHPFTTSSFTAVDAGAIIPPGHMQNENTPLPSTCSTRLYEAGGKLFSKELLLPYCIELINSWGCSILTPSAKPFA